MELVPYLALTPQTNPSSFILDVMLAANKFLFGLLTALPTLVRALRNITIDDTDSIIKYTGTWESDSGHYSDLDYGGAHTVSSDPTGSASFTFTGA